MTRILTDAEIEAIQRHAKKIFPVDEEFDDDYGRGIDMNDKVRDEYIDELCEQLENSTESAEEIIKRSQNQVA